MEKKRSIGVTIVGKIFLTLSFLYLFAILVLCLTGPGLIHRRVIPSSRVLILVLMLLGIFSILSFIIGRSLLRLKKWALFLAIIVTVFHGLASFISIFTDWHGLNEELILRIGICICGWSIFYFLTRPKVKEQFK